MASPAGAILVLQQTCFEAKGKNCNFSEGLCNFGQQYHVSFVIHLYEYNFSDVYLAGKTSLVVSHAATIDAWLRKGF